MKVGADNLVGLLSCAYEIAGQLGTPAVQVLIRHRIQWIGPLSRQLDIFTRRFVLRKVEGYAAAWL